MTFSTNSFVLEGFLYFSPQLVDDTKDTINGLIVITMCKDHWEYSVTSVTRGTCLVTQPNELTEQQSKVTSFIQNFLVTEYQMLLSFIFAFWTILNNKYHFKLKIVS